MNEKVLITRQIPVEAIRLLEEKYDLHVHAEPRPMSSEELTAGLQGASALLCMLHDRVNGALLDRAPGLKVVANMAVGVDNIDLEACTGRGVMVTNTPGVLTEATADFTFALLLAVARRVVEADRFVREGRFIHWDPLLLLGGDLHGKTIGIVGLGRIGRAVARRAQGFGMRLLYHNRRPLSEAEEIEIGAIYLPLNDLIRQADFLTLHLPYSPVVRHLINRERLDLMKPTAYLVNTARGLLVDEVALTDCLRKGRIAGAALDVYENEPQLSPGLEELNNVVLAPHLGSASLASRQKMAVIAATSIEEALQGQKPCYLVNPAVLEKGGRGTNNDQNTN